ncbi:gamma-glutamyl-gamma-aminobutyrate hydrolase family protein [Lysinibacillus sp. FSL K6-0232]|uniref:gamma-glutamyl-gamma-aminobutyrate hydrolase family protein n=1 Tax=unclassified Lysinibacillus TaxID=2636778 RepID=UPI0030FBA8F8
MKPIIGITAFVDDSLSSQLNAAYSKSIIEAGGIPLIIPIGVEQDVAEILALTDGLLLSGGHDIHPFLFGEDPSPNIGKVHPARDAVEVALIEEAITRKMPIFGICRGLQILNVALGGTLYQDIDSDYAGTKLLQHAQQSDRMVATHYVQIAANNLLMDIIGQEKIAVNSLHHQAVKILADNCQAAALSSDGIVEAMVYKELPFCLAVQWHPEELATVGDQHALKLFSAFIEASLKFKKHM